MSDHHKSEKQKKAAAMGAVARKKGDSANNKSQATRNITSDKQPSKLKLKDFNEALKEAGSFLLESHLDLTFIWPAHHLNRHQEIWQTNREETKQRHCPETFL
jgi:hypothetical protein